MTNGRVNGVKGVTYKFSGSGTPTLFSAELRQGEAWFRRYSNDAAFDASEQEFGSAASFAGQDTPTIAPKSGSQDVLRNEYFSVSQIPDGTVVDSFSEPFFGAVSPMWDGQYLWIHNGSAEYIYRYDLDSQSSGLNFSYPSNRNITPLSWDGEYILAGGDSGIYFFDTSGNEKNYLPLSPEIDGLAWDGSYYITFDGPNNNINFVNTSGQVVRTASFNVNAGATSDITVDGTYILFASNRPAVVYQLDYDLNQVSSFAAPAPDVDGVAWDGEYAYTPHNSAKTVYRVGGSTSFDVSYRFFEVT